MFLCLFQAFWFYSIFLGESGIFSRLSDGERRAHHDPVAAVVKPRFHFLALFGQEYLFGRSFPVKQQAEILGSGTMTVDMGGGQSFTINYDGIRRMTLADAVQTSPRI